MISNAHEHDDDRSVSLMAIGQYMREVRWVPSLTDEELEKLLQRVERGNAERVQLQPNEWVLSLAKHAREELAEAFQPLVISVARRFEHRFKSMDLMDLVQEGNLGLVGALDRWRVPTFDGSFVAFAVVRIRGAIWRALCDRDSGVHVPVRLSELFMKSQKVGCHLRGVLGRDALPAELAAELGVSEDELVEAREAASCRETKSLQGLLAEDRTEDMYNFVALYDAAVVAEDARQAGLAEVFRQALEQVVSPSQRQAVELRYGFGEAPSALRPQEAVADLLGVSQHRVSDAEIAVKERLGHVLDLVYLVDGRPTCVLDPAYALDLADRGGYCSTGEAAQLLGVSEGRVRYYARRGDLPFVWQFRCGKSRQRFFEKRVIMEFARSRGSAVEFSSVA